MTWLGRLDSAAGLADEAIESARLGLNDQSLAWSLTLRCWIATLAGDLRLAQRCGDEALEVTVGSVRDSYFSALTACYVAETRLEAGDPARARQELVAGGRGADLPVIEPSYRSHFYEMLTRCALALDEPGEARAWASRAERCARHSPLGGRQAEALMARAAVQLADRAPRKPRRVPSQPPRRPNGRATASSPAELGRWPAARSSAAVSAGKPPHSSSGRWEPSRPAVRGATRTRRRVSCASWAGGSPGRPAPRGRRRDRRAERARAGGGRAGGRGSHQPPGGGGPVPQREDHREPPRADLRQGRRVLTGGPRGHVRRPARRAVGRGAQALG